MASQTDAKTLTTGNGVVELVRQAIERVRPWMATYVKSSLDWTVSENDFTERIVERLVAKEHCAESPLDFSAPESVELAVKKSLKGLVYEAKRSAYRRGETSLDHAIPDPQGASFVTELENQAAAREILNRIPDDLLPAVELLYGLGGKDEMSTRAIAAKLGIKEEVLRQRLSRLRSDLRRRLRKSV